MGDRAVIVTGAGSGIGRATAIALAAKGWRVALVGRTLSTLEETLGMLEGDLHTCIRVDIGDPVDSDRVVDEAVDALGGLNAIVNNAGKADLAPIEETTTEMLEDSFAVNAMGPAILIARGWPHLCEAEGACVVNVSTKGTLDPFPGFFVYAAMKAPLNLMVKSVANEGRPHGIRAFAVAPGATETGMLRSMFDEKQIPAGATKAPEDVADVIVACIEGERDEENGRLIVVSN